MPRWHRLWALVLLIGCGESTEPEASTNSIDLIVDRVGGEHFYVPAVYGGEQVFFLLDTGSRATF